MGTPSRSARDEWLLPTLEGLLPREQLVQLKSAVGESFWETAVRQNVVTDDQLLAALAKRFRMQIANVSQVSPQAGKLMPQDLARKYHVLPLAITDAVLDIATADPHDLDCERTIAFALGRTVRMSLASPMQITMRLEQVYRRDNATENRSGTVAQVADLASIPEPDDEAEAEVGATRGSERPVIQLVDRIVVEGIQSRASDIHLEPEETGVAVRYRIDGLLRKVMVLPKAAGVPLVSRVKIMAQLDIADRLRPQDGRAHVTVSGNRVDLRVSTLPASQGEKVVIRILDQRATVLALDTIGLHADEVEQIRALLDTREGIILVTGPTGSGKTTTLYALLREIQARGVNIVTVEDPVEYRIAGIVQVQVNEKARLTFPAALRSILRQDPDVILVGEIRDKETADIAIQASLTGHLVLSTLHTIDAATSVTRLVDIGVDAYKIAAALKGVLAQRLVRRLCRHCRKHAVERVPERLRQWFPQEVKPYRAVGCAECSQTGYRGRLALTEILTMSSEIERRIAGNETADRIAKAASESGMRSLWKSGVSHVGDGTTTLEEVLRVIEAPGDCPERASTTAPGNSTAQMAASTDGAPAQARLSPPPMRSTYSTPGAFDNESFRLLDEGSGVHVNAGKVLLVEDEDTLRRIMKDLLEREGFTVFEAADGVVALNEIDRVDPDVVVLDLNLPRLDGYGVLSHLRSRAATASLPVVVLTAKGDEDSEVRAFEYGASDCLTKPFRLRALSARLQSLLSRARA